MMKKKEESKKKCTCKCCDDAFVAIPASLAGIYLVIVLFVLLFATNPAAILVPVAWTFVILGFFALLFAYRAQVVKK